MSVMGRMVVEIMVSTFMISLSRLEVAARCVCIRSVAISRELSSSSVKRTAPAGRFIAVPFGPADLAAAKARAATVLAAPAAGRIDSPPRDAGLMNRRLAPRAADAFPRGRGASRARLGNAPIMSDTPSEPRRRGYLDPRSLTEAQRQA